MPSNERLVDVTTPLGEALWFRQMTGTEALSEMFEFDVTFHSDKIGLSAKQMLGKDVTMKIETAGGLAGKTGIRYLNGICTRFASGGREGQHLIYTAKLRPWLWLASRQSDCRSFQNKSVPEIIDIVLGPYGFVTTKKLKGGYRRREFCVQYQETDLNFVMRLMEDEGIYFYFAHSQGKHELVLVDDISHHAKLPEKPVIKYYGLDASAVVHEEHFNSWDVREEVDPGEYSTRDYDFKKPRDTLETRRRRPMKHAQDSKERYTWPGGYVNHGDGDKYAQVRLEALQAEQERAQGHCTVRTMGPGYLFKLENCPRADQNREYLSVAATYFFRDNARMSAGSGDGDAAWSITVTSQPSSLPYRPQMLTPRPRTHGPQTAVVVGSGEIDTDEYARVKVHFFWDRVEQDSCWIRVSQPWAGNKWGMIHIPRVGQEVVIDFIGGDPDYPIITGRVYNADKMPPYSLPANKTQSGIKSRSSEGGGSEDFNEIRMEDKKGQEQIYIHAQKDLETRVENDEKRQVDRDRKSLIKRDDTRDVNGDDKHTILGGQTTKVIQNHTFDVIGSSTTKVVQPISVTGVTSIDVKTPMTSLTTANLNMKPATTTIMGGALTATIGVNSVTGVVTITGPVVINGAVIINGAFMVNGASALNGAVGVQGAMKVTGVCAASAFIPCP